MVEAGLGVAILPRLRRWKCGYAVIFISLADPRARRTVGRVARAGCALEADARQFLEYIHRETRDGAKEFGYAAL
jgi:LysR family transcriptional regulator, carnitine catabolism transcriptional activator